MATEKTVKQSDILSAGTGDTVNGQFTTIGNLLYLAVVNASDISSAAKIRFLNSTDEIYEDVDDFGPINFGNSIADETVFFEKSLTIKSLTIQNIDIAEGVFIDFNDVCKANATAIAGNIYGAFFIPAGGMLEFCVKATEHIVLTTDGSTGTVLITARLSNR